MNKNQRAVQLQNLRSSLATKEFEIATKAEISKRTEELFSTLQEITLAIEKMKTVLLMCNEGLSAYKEERLKCLEEQVKDNLKIIFPNDNFNVKFKATTFRNKEVIDFYTGHDDRLFPTFMQNGRLFRQICSFSISTMIQILAGCEILIMDEAINSGDKESTTVVASLIHNLIDNGYQVILIEHKDELYRNLPRYQYNLHRDNKTNKITEVSFNEYT